MYGDFCLSGDLLITKRTSYRPQTPVICQDFATNVLADFILGREGNS